MELQENKFLAVLAPRGVLDISKDKTIIALGASKVEIQGKVQEFISETAWDISDVKIIPYQKIITPSMQVTF